MAALPTTDSNTDDQIGPHAPGFREAQDSELATLIRMGTLAPVRTSDGRIAYIEPDDDGQRTSIDPKDDRKMPARALDPDDDHDLPGPDPPQEDTVRYRIDRGTNNRISTRHDTTIVTRPLTQGQRDCISSQMTAIQGTSVSVVQGPYAIHASQVHHQSVIYHTGQDPSSWQTPMELLGGTQPDFKDLLDSRDPIYSEAVLPAFADTWDDSKGECRAVRQHTPLPPTQFMQPPFDQRCGASTSTPSTDSPFP